MKGRPIEPGSIRQEARRRGVSEYRVRKERTLAEQGQMVCPTCAGAGVTESDAHLLRDLEALTAMMREAPRVPGVRYGGEGVTSSWGSQL